MKKLLIFPLLLLLIVAFSSSIRAGMGGYGYYKYEPSIRISDVKGGYSSGGFVSIASTDEPAINIGSYDTEGQAELSLYEADENALFDYLTHDKDNNQIQKNFDLSKFKLVTTISQYIKKGYDSNSRVTLPLSDQGIWLLRTKLGTKVDQSFIARSNVGVIAKEGKGELIFWGQNFKTGRSITEGTVTTYNLENGKKAIAEGKIGTNGIGLTPFSADIDIAFVKSGNDIALVPLNLKYMNSGYKYTSFQPKVYTRKYFVFTDRPLYKPGDTIYFKAVLREDDDARYSIPQGLATIKIYKDYDEKNLVYEKNVQITSDGTVYGEYKLNNDAATGYYNLKVILPKLKSYSDYEIWESNSTSFQVQFFRKPEYYIDVNAPQTEAISKDQLSVTILGKYFSGQPITSGNIKYTIRSADFYEYEYLSDRPYSLSDEYRYGYWYSDAKASEGFVNFNTQGIASLAVPTSISDGKSKVFTVEATFDNGSGNPSFDRKNILIFAGEFSIFRKDYTGSSSKVDQPLNIPIVLVPNRNTNISNIPILVKVHRENWVKYIDPNQKYPQYKKEEEDLQGLTASTNSAGEAQINFTPKKEGSYKFTLESKDQKGNLITKTFYSWVYEEGVPYYSTNQDTSVTITSDKSKYLPSDTMSFNVASELPDRDVLVAIERGRVERYKVVSLKGKSQTVEMPIEATDIPNIYAFAYTFSNSYLEVDSKDLTISSDSKKMVVNITPDQKVYGPSDTVKLNITTTDVAGNPISSDLAVWAVDKALFELVDQKPENIFDLFWSHRYHDARLAHSLEGINVQSGAEGGGCFAPETQILMGDGTKKEIKQVVPGDKILTRENNKLIKAKVNNVKSATTSGLLIINQTLKTTPDHIVKVDNSWKEAGSIQIGDYMENSGGDPIEVKSIEYIKGVYTVYNLEIDKYHTFIAENYLVHNQKGGDAREVFKDTAYWNPSVRTDSSGRAQVTFKLPDNLTTWVASALGASQNTSAGQVTTDIQVSQSVIVRPILPNILREDDQVVLSALVQNFTESPQNFDVSLIYDGGKVDEATKSSILVNQNETKQLYWSVLAGKENENASVVVSATSKESVKNSDAIKVNLPVRPFGFYEKKAEVGDGPKDFQVKSSQDSNLDKSSLTLSLSSTLLGTLPTAMSYLVNYPYGCVEQTISRFVPAVIAKANKDLYAQSLDGKDVDAMIKKGLERLSLLQHGDGGWTWWYQGSSNTFITAYVFENLILAQNAGVTVDEVMFNRAKTFLENSTYYDPNKKLTVDYSGNDLIFKTYALSYLKSPKYQSILTGLDRLDSDVVAMAVMANMRNGYEDPGSNGLNILTSRAKTQGDSLYWSKGSKYNFGSDDASTALAIKALLQAGNRDMAIKAVRYLMRSRIHDYWSNTYATSHVVSALTEFAKTGSETSPNYSYKVLLDGKEISKGEMNSNSIKSVDIKINAKDIKPLGSSISITKDGEGQIYETLIANEFHTNRNTPALSKGLNIKREYVSEKGEEYTPSVGDLVDVNLTIGGLSAEESYAVIEDVLPAGLVPVNQNFNNEQGNVTYEWSYDITDREITENGTVLTLYRIAPGERKVSYKARVVSEGKFVIPPATISLMYSPEIYGRSNSEMLTTTKKPEIVPGKAIKKTLEKQSPSSKIASIGATLTVLATLVVLIALVRKKLAERKIQK